MAPRRPEHPPRHYVDNWPERPANSDAPPEVYLVLDIVERLKAGMEKKEKSVPALAKDARTTRQTIYHLLAGKAWPELSTIVWIERGLGLRIWGSAHKSSPDPVEPVDTDEPPD